ncbi:MAG: tetratricopeptide repeat protein [Nitrospirae bacterium]|nr:tetratricopeptide repeat protein [Nitrospirota bacterium]
MTESSSKKIGLVLITALGLTVAVVLLLIVRERLSPTPAEGPKTEQETAPRPAAAKDEPVLTIPADRSEREPPLRILMKPGASPPASVSDHDPVTAQLNNEGLTHYSRGDYSEAAALFQKAFERDGQNRTLRNNLALAKGNLAWKQVEARQYREALENYQSAVRLVPDEPTFFLGQGLAYDRLNEPDRAVQSLKEAIALNPKMPEAYKILGDVYYQRDEIEMAAGYYEKGLELDPSDPALRLHLAKVRREKETQAGFQQEASRVFTVKFEGREERDAAQRALRDLEEAYREIGKAASYYPQQPITVILYSDQQFRDVTRTASWTQGLFDGKIRVPIGGAATEPDLLKKVLFHEYTHAVVHGLSRGLAVPTWLNEGMAVYFESEDSTSREQHLLRQLRSGATIIPIEQLHGSFMGLSDNQAALAYDESYSAVKTLIGRYGLYRLMRLLEDMGNQKDFAAAFSDQFMVSYETFQSDWRRTLQGAVPR